MADIDHPKVQRMLNSGVLAHLATLGPDGSPHSSPMWFLWDGTHLLFTHTKDRQKYRNLQRDPRVSVSLKDAEEPFAHAELRGQVERMDDDPDGAFFDQLAERYDAPIRYAGDPRVIVRVRIDKVVGQGL